MTLVVDIPCPECGRTEPVRKLGIDTYRCVECDHEFGPGDVDLDEDVNAGGE